MSLNLADSLEMAAAAAPSRTGLVCEGHTLTFRQWADASRRIADALHKRSIGPGDRVAFVLPNTLQFPIVLYGILGAGAVAVPMNVLLQSQEFLYQLEAAGVTAAFVYEPLQETFLKAFHLSSCCKHLFIVEPDLTPSSPTTGESFVRMMMAGDPSFDPVRARPDDTAEIIFTSAVGGYPLGTELTHFNLFQNALICQAFVQKYGPGDVCLCVLPLFHSFGQTAMLNAPLMGRSKTILMPRFETYKVFDTIAEKRVTLMGLVPSMAHFMVSYKRGQHFDLSSIRAIDVGGSALSMDLYEAFLNRFGIPLLQGYGLTEASPVVSYNTDNTLNRPGSVGKPIWHCAVRIRREDGSFAGSGEAGEIVIRGHNVMKGYYNKPEATAQTLRDGWLHTGDLGFLDADGYLYITGLKKDLIIRAGMNIYPREIEQTLLRHPAIAEAVVIGVPEPVRGEEVWALLQVKPGYAPEEKELRAFCLEHMAAFKCPRRFEYCESFPRDSEGKVDKQSLKRTFGVRCS